MISDIKNNEVARFILVGGINTIFGYGVFAILVFFNLNYRIALIISTILGIIFNYFTISGAVFKEKGVFIFIKFFAVYFIVYFINIGLLELLSYITTNKIIGQLICLPIVVGVSFLLNKLLVFRRKSK